MAGSPEGSLPRIADEEMPGEQIILKGYYVDVFPYPNEEGAIPLSNVTQAGCTSAVHGARQTLVQRARMGTRLQGPRQSLPRYEYGEAYHAERCGTGALPVMRPTGIRVACHSEFGVRDMHGGAWEWTSSPWGRRQAARPAS